MTNHANRKPYLCLASPEQIDEFLKSISGARAYRRDQILGWIYEKLELAPARMSNLPENIRLGLSESFTCCSSKIIESSGSLPDTVKHLIKLSDGNCIEAVIISAPKRKTFCLSSQVGCPVQCAFCASGSGGLVRNMSGGEMLEQFYLCADYISSLPDNIVFMGSGEALLNFSNLENVLNILTSPSAIGFSPRRITVSTSGVPREIKRLADSFNQVSLAVSLHAPDDETRAELIPGKIRFPVDEIIDACIYYFKKTGRIVTLEYVLIKGVNDSVKHARMTARVAKKINGKVNLIPYNEVPGSGFEKPSLQSVKDFRKILRKNKTPVTLRVEKGSGINAACGQLRAGRISS